MASLLDTSVAIHLRDLDGQALARVAELPRLPVLSLLSLAELQGGVHARQDLAANRKARLDALLERIPLVGFDREIVTVYGTIVAAIGFNRRTIIDRLIAATAIRHDMELITTNPRDFAPIPGLRVIDWS